jgi:hypothetical protein
VENGRLKLPMGEVNGGCFFASYRLHRAYQGEPISAMVSRNEQRSAIQLRDFSMINIENSRNKQWCCECVSMYNVNDMEVCVRWWSDKQALKSIITVLNTISIISLCLHH